MIKHSSLPIYDYDLELFVAQLRLLVFSSQKKAAAYFYLHRSRVVRYENSLYTDKPQVGYLAALAQLIVNNADAACDEAELKAMQQTLLKQLNKALGTNNYQAVKFVDWEGLCYEAENYLQQQEAKHKAKKKAKAKVKVAAPPQLPPPVSITKPNITPSATNIAASWQEKLSLLDLPPTRKLIGATKNIKQLLDIINHPQSPWVISIEGMGGLGKTTLASEIIRNPSLSHNFKGVAWVSAKEQDFSPGLSVQQYNQSMLDLNSIIDLLLMQLDDSFPLSLPPIQKKAALNKCLKQNSYVVVIDNLETVSNYQHLIQYVCRWANPSKILLTSRHSLGAYPDVFCFNLPPLKRKAGINLIKHEAEVKGYPLNNPTHNKDLTAIYNIVGGNPLVLKLTVGQISVLSLQQVVANLKNKQNQEVNQLSAYLYHQAWLSLNNIEQQLLLMMPLVENGTAEQLMALSELEASTFYSALQHLVSVSLIQVVGDLQERRYTAHRLTESFILGEKLQLKEKLQWSTVDSDNIQQQTFQAGIKRNISYWLNWLQNNKKQAANIVNKQEGIVKAILYGFKLPEIWLDVYKLLILFGPTLEMQGRRELWSQILRQALKMAQQQGDSSKEANLLVLLGRVSYQARAFSQSEIYYKQAIELAKTINNQFVEARACTNLGYYYIEQGDWQQAKKLCQHALTLFETINSNYGRAHTENHLGLLYTWQEKWDKAQKHLTQACKLWQIMGDDHGLMRGYINLGVLCIKMETFDKALHYLNKATNQATLTNDSVTPATILQNIGLAHTLTGDFKQGEQYNKQAEAIYHQFLDQAGLAQVWNNLGVTYLYQKQIEQAKYYLDKSLQGWQELNNKRGQIATLIDLVEYALSIKDIEQANNYINQATRLIESNKNKTQYGYLQKRLTRHKKQLAT